VIAALFPVQTLLHALVLERYAALAKALDKVFTRLQISTLYPVFQRAIVAPNFGRNAHSLDHAFTCCFIDIVREEKQRRVGYGCRPVRKGFWCPCRIDEFPALIAITTRSHVMQLRDWMMLGIIEDGLLAIGSAIHQFIAFTAEPEGPELPVF